MPDVIGCDIDNLELRNRIYHISEWAVSGPDIYSFKDIPQPNIGYFGTRSDCIAYLKNMTS